MTHPMPDQDTTTEPPKRMTTAEAAKTAQEAALNASAALRVAQSADDMVAAMSEKITDIETRLGDLATGGVAMVADPSAGLVDADGKPVVTRDQVDSRIHEALAPLHQEVHELRAKGTLTPESKGSLAGVLARLEDAERKVAAVDANGLTTQVAATLHPMLTDIRNRLGALEEHEPEGPGNDGNRARFDQLARELAELRVHLGAIDNRVLSVTPGATTSKGTGAAKKVLQLMRLVTSIGKEKEANLGERGGRFMFRGVDQAMDAVGHAMREVGVILGTEILKDETTQNAVTKAGEDSRGRKYENTVVWTTTKLTVRYTFTDPEDGSTHSMEMTGEGRDASDKSTSKAASMALKYGLFQALMIPVTGLDDSDAAPPQYVEQHREQAPSQPQAPASQPSSNTDQRANDQARAQRAGEALAAIRNVYRVEGGPQAQYNRLVQIMNQVKSEGLLDVAVEGVTLNHHGQAAMRTLQAPPPPDDARASTEPPEPPDHDGSNYGETGGY